MTRSRSESLRGVPVILERPQPSVVTYAASYDDGGGLYALYRQTKANGSTVLEYLKADGWLATGAFIDHWIMRGAMRLTEERARELARGFGMAWA